jgi:lipopolysaccharide export system protein LptA
MSRLLKHAAVCAIVSLGFSGAASAATHIAAVTRNSVPAPSKEARKLPIDITSSKVDYKGDTVVFQDVVITQGETRVQADRAHAIGLDDFENSRWTFEGNVKINGEQRGSLKSDMAVVEFRNKYISRATATGNPAEFEQKRSDSDEVARGHAREIVYDVSNGTVRLSTDAYVWDGHNELSASELVYNIREQHVQASGQPGTGSQVHFRIDPNAAHEDLKKKP